MIIDNTAYNILDWRESAVTTHRIYNIYYVQYDSYIL